MFVSLALLSSKFVCCVTQITIPSSPSFRTSYLVAPSPKADFLSAASDRIVGRRVEVTLTRHTNKFPLPVIMHLVEEEGEDQNQNPKRTNVARMFKQMG